MAGTRNYQSIGEVLVSVKTEFPDITISKIRFLEAEGLIEPERTPSGYRKFYVDDDDRLRGARRGAHRAADVDRGDVGSHRGRARSHQGARVVRDRVFARTGR